MLKVIRNTYDAEYNIVYNGIPDGIIDISIGSNPSEDVCATIIEVVKLVNKQKTKEVIKYVKR